MNGCAADQGAQRTCNRTLPRTSATATAKRPVRRHPDVLQPRTPTWLKRRRVSGRVRTASGAIELLDVYENQMRFACVVTNKNNEVITAYPEAVLKVPGPRRGSRSRGTTSSATRSPSSRAEALMAAPNKTQPASQDGFMGRPKGMSGPRLRLSGARRGPRTGVAGVRRGSAPPLLQKFRSPGGRGA